MQSMFENDRVGEGLFTGVVTSVNESGILQISVFLSLKRLLCQLKVPLMTLHSPKYYTN